MLVSAFSQSFGRSTRHLTAVEPDILLQCKNIDSKPPEMLCIEMTREGCFCVVSPSVCRG